MMTKTLLVGTRKGLLVFEKSPSQGSWKVANDGFLGIPVCMVYVDEREDQWWVALDHGHWGMKLHRSVNRGQSWDEVEAPKYPEGTLIKEDVPASLHYIWAFAHGGKEYPGKLYIGTEPGGLFEMNGDGFILNESLWNQPSRTDQWFGGGRDYPGIHSIVVDPQNSDHIYVGISCAGVFETADRGANWQVRNDGLRADFLPDPHAEVGHDPHLLLASPTNPKVMWQQNHCGIFRSINGGARWQEVSDTDGPANFGFALAVDDQDENRAWVAPAVSDVTRVAVDQALCICRTDDAGQSWLTFREGLPQEHCYDIVYRHGLVASGNDVIFGTTTGNLFASENAGESWSPISHHLAMVYCLCFA
ncbi:MAG: hypothetical protein OEQ53_04095 [Saprospiraceae bacterium]|nr:hypothetical protein [Saprospiraceae bacterium]